MSMSTATTTAGVTEYISWSDFGSFLTKLRCRRGLSQEVFAAQVGCHRTHIWRLEHGRNHPSRMFLRNLRATYQLSSLEDSLLNGFQYLHLYRLETAALPTVLT
jgi:transcriptional regulator with XRE-family HTH domain